MWHRESSFLGMSRSAIDTVRAVSGPIGAFGGAFMLHPDTLSSCKDFGYPNGFAYYVAGRGGVEKAQRFGWQEPFPDASSLRDKRLDAERLTDDLQVPVYESSLSTNERSEFVNLVNDLVVHLKQILASENS